MPVSERFGVLLLMPLLYAYAVGQDAKPSTTGGPIQLDVVVTEKSGTPVSGLRLEDFTLLDNNVPRTITSFEALNGRQRPIEVVLLLDALNVDLKTAGVELDGINSFLTAGEGRLPYPTMVAILAGMTVQFPQDFSQDGNQISAALDQRMATFGHNGDAKDYGAAARFQISLQCLRSMVEHEVGRPGRKFILWVSPGWSELSRSQRMQSAMQEQQVFDSIVDLSTQLREYRITLYSIDPLSMTDIGSRKANWEAYLNGVTGPGQVRRADLALPVIATQSGGLAINSGNNIAEQIRKCLADAEAYYEIAFDPGIGGGPNEYHRLAVRVVRPGLAARGRQGYYSRPWRSTNFRLPPEEPGIDGDKGRRDKLGTDRVAPTRTRDQLWYTSPQPYVDEPLPELVERIPDLKSLRPGLSQGELPAILQKMGHTVDDFVRDVGELIAHEDVIQEKLSTNGKIEAKRRFQDDYLIIHRGNEWGARAEYRMDEKGKRFKATGLAEGYLVTSGYALSCIAFATAAQSESRFRYFGEQEIDSRETYVLGFAQQPGKASFLTTLMLNGGPPLDMLTQGILWVDKNSFQIIRMRSDLLAQRNEGQLDQLTADVRFIAVQLRDVPNPLWLPGEVRVYIETYNELGKNLQEFRNVHHYTNYRRYRVSAKIGAPQ